MRDAKYRIFVVDDHPLFRQGIAGVICQDTAFEICGEAADAPEALRKLAETKPHVVIVDITLESGHGIQLIEEIKARWENTRVLVVSVHEDSLFAERALRAGAMGYLNKRSAADDVLTAIHRILRGEVYLGADISGQLLKMMVGGETLLEDPINGLSNRELEVFEKIGEGKTTKEIAGILHLSPKTIETHREKIKSKLGLSNSTELSHRATQWVLQGK